MRVHEQGLGGGQAAGFGAYCTNQTAEGKSRRLKEQLKAEANTPTAVTQPILERNHSILFPARLPLPASYRSRGGWLQCP